MAITCGFYNSKNGDRLYESPQISQLFDGVLSDGVFKSIGNGFYPERFDNKTININTGRCWFKQSMWLDNNEPISFKFEAIPEVSRIITAIVLEFNTDTRTARITTVQGKDAVTNYIPVLDVSGPIYQYPICYVYQTIYDIWPTNNVVYVVGTEECPWVENLAGSTDVSELITQYTNEWNTWFEETKAYFVGDQEQQIRDDIDTALSISDRATVDDVAASTREDKWLSPQSLFGIVPLAHSTGTLFSIPSNSSITLNIPNVLPATGGTYSQSEYPDLYNVLGSAYGSRLNANLKSSGVNSNGVYTKRDPVTGYIYRIGATIDTFITYDVLDENYEVIKTIRSPGTTAPTQFDLLDVYSNVLLFQMKIGNYGYLYVSPDGGDTWSVSQQSTALVGEYSSPGLTYVGGGIISIDKQFAYFTVGSYNYSWLRVNNFNYLYHLPSKTWFDTTLGDSATGDNGSFYPMRVLRSYTGTPYVIVHRGSETSNHLTYLYQLVFESNGRCRWSLVRQMYRQSTAYATNFNQLNAENVETWHGINNDDPSYAYRYYVYSQSNGQIQSNGAPIGPVALDINDLIWTISSTGTRQISKKNGQSLNINFTTPLASNPVDIWMKNAKIIGILTTNLGSIYEINLDEFFFNVPNIGTSSNASWYIRT